MQMEAGPSSSRADAAGQDAALQMPELLRQRSSDGRMSRWWADFDSQVMQPVFGGPPQPVPKGSPPDL